MAASSAVALVCTLKKSPAPSSSEVIARQVLDALGEHDVKGTVVRVVDHDILPGVGADEGPGDHWPLVREQIAAADILLVSTPTWVGHMSSVAQRVLERLDAELSNTDDEDRPAMVGKVATVAGMTKPWAAPTIRISIQCRRRWPRRPERSPETPRTSRKCSARSSTRPIVETSIRPRRHTGSAQSGQDGVDGLLQRRGLGRCGRCLLPQLQHSRSDFL